LGLGTDFLTGFYVMLRLPSVNETTNHGKERNHKAKQQQLFLKCQWPTFVGL